MNKPSIREAECSYLRIPNQDVVRTDGKDRSKVIDLSGNNVVTVTTPTRPTFDRKGTDLRPQQKIIFD